MPTPKYDIISRVISATLAILYRSHFNGTSLWPKDGFKVGNGLSSNPKECIFIGVNAYGWDQNPIKGNIRLWTTTPNELRELRQCRQINLIMTHAIYDGIYFYDEYEDRAYLKNHLQLNFTIQD